MAELPDIDCNISVELILKLINNHSLIYNWYVDVRVIYMITACYRSYEMLYCIIYRTSLA